MPDLRLTPERRAELRFLYTLESGLKWAPAKDLRDAIHDLDVLERLLRRAVAAQIGWEPLDGPGHECLTCGGSPTAHAKRCWVGDAQVLLQGIDAALAALRGENRG